MSRLILISGAARSGKSSFAELCAAEMDRPVAYLATAQALDKEMESRIEFHKRRRPSNWYTFEEPLAIEEVIGKNSDKYNIWLLDCITLYIANLLHSQPLEVKDNNLVAAGHIQDCLMQKINSFLDAVKNTDITMFIVTNEVGWGLVPADPVSRLYRDVVGRINQRLAQEAQEVFLLTLGIPLRIKPEPITIYNSQ